MAQSTQKYVRGPPMLSHSIKNFSDWKMLMINYLNLINIWEAVEKPLTPEYNETTNILTT